MNTGPALSLVRTTMVIFCSLIENDKRTFLCGCWLPPLLNLCITMIAENISLSWHCNFLGQLLQLSHHDACLAMELVYITITNLWGDWWSHWPWADMLFKAPQATRMQTLMAEEMFINRQNTSKMPLKKKEQLWSTSFWSTPQNNCFLWWSSGNPLCLCPFTCYGGGGRGRKGAGQKAHKYFSMCLTVLRKLWRWEAKACRESYSPWVCTTITFRWTYSRMGPSKCLGLQEYIGLMLP